ncbi:MAG: OmpA family protein [Ilumatobacteraceae bacterium]
MRPELLLSRNSRRIPVVLGVIASLGLIIGAPLYLRAVEDDLAGRVLAAAVEAEPMVNGVTFDGQDGTVFCVTPLDYPASLVAALKEVSGVRSITADRTCRVLRAPTVDPNLPVAVTVATSTTTTVASPIDPTTTTLGSSTTTTTSVPEPETEGDAIVEQLTSDPALTTFARIIDASGRIAGESGPITLLAPVDGAFDDLGADALAALLADPTALDALIDRHLLDDDGDRVVPDGDNLIVDGTARLIDRVDVGSSSIWLIDAVLASGDLGVVPTLRVDLAVDGIEIIGTLADQTTLDRFVVAASAAGLPVNVTVDPNETTTVAPADVGPLERLIRAMVTLLDTASLSVDDDSVTLIGTRFDETDADTVAALARVLDAEVTITARPSPTQAEIDRLNDVIAELVAADPISFESGSARIVAGSNDVLAQIAAILERNAELEVTVRGHTDSNGVPASNLALGASRADAVVNALVDLGIDAGRLTAQGVGSAEPVVIDGIEDPERSRRVEFVLVGG